MTDLYTVIVIKKIARHKPAVNVAIYSIGLSYLRTSGFLKPAFSSISIPVDWNILKFTWQPGEQSDMVWCYSGLQI